MPVAHAWRRSAAEEGSTAVRGGGGPNAHEQACREGGHEARVERPREKKGKEKIKKEKENRRKKKKRKGIK